VPLDLPKSQIHQDPPNVWLTSFWAWSPKTWGCVGFSDIGRQRTMLREMEEGALWVIYVTKNAPAPTPKELKGKIIGIYQLSLESGHSSTFIEPEQYSNFAGKWVHAIRATQAWTISEGDRFAIEDFASESYFNENGKNRGRSIGRYGRRLTQAESRKILNLKVKEAEVYQGHQVDDNSPEVRFKDVLTPSKPGPAFEGMALMDRTKNTKKELYILKLKGHIGSFLDANDKSLKGHNIIKVGLSYSPASRQCAFNKALPGNAYEWELLHSTLLDKDEIYSCHKVAVAGEQAMVDFLKVDGKSLGGEFFLASDCAIEQAWKIGREAALKKERSR